MLRFGTDGIRGDADADLTTPLMVALGRAAARVLGSGKPFLIGRDTRLSGPRIEADLAAGLAVEGARVADLGVLPTPAIAFYAAREDVPAAVISASHNSYTDNGVKLLAPGGRKLGDDVEAAIEVELERALSDASVRTDTAPEASVSLGGVPEAYIAHLAAALEGRTLNGMRVVLDCANGAASRVGPDALRAAGADVVVLNSAPDGRNINRACGSTNPAVLQRAVVEHGARAGMALDGDADRVLLVDEHGSVVDGDQIMAIAALDLRARGRLRNDAIAATVMSNLGLRRCLADAGMRVIETPVGDRSVLIAMEEHDLSLGGEQSGHVIFADLATTGDGLLTGLLVLDRMARAGATLSSLASVMIRSPQVLVAVRVDRAPDLDTADGVWDAVRAIEAELGDTGRVLVRGSGTEPVVRVMVEAPTEATARGCAARLEAAVREAFPASV